MRIEYVLEKDSGEDNATRIEYSLDDDASNDDATRISCIAESNVDDDLITQVDCFRDQKCEDSEHCVFDLCLKGCDDLPDLVMPEGEHRCIKGVHNYCNVVIGGTLEVVAYEYGGGKLELHASERIEVLPTGAIVADGAGYPSDRGNAAGVVWSGGGGYGGRGGLSADAPSILPVPENFEIQPIEPRPTYGDASTRTIEMGSGGVGATGTSAGSFSGGSGGGAITLIANEIFIAGEVSARGTPGRPQASFSGPGAGSGGGLLAIAENRIVLTGRVSVTGGTACPSNGTGGGGGGGGRVKLFAPSGTAAGDINAAGGGGGQGAEDSLQGSPGEDGSIYISFL